MVLVQQRRKSKEITMNQKQKEILDSIERISEIDDITLRAAEYPAWYEDINLEELEKERNNLIQPILEAFA